MKTALLAMLAVFCSTALFAAQGDAVKADPAADLRTVSIHADKIVINAPAPGPGAPGDFADDERRPAPPPPPPSSPRLGVGESLAGALTAFADWDGFRPWKIVYLLCGFVLSVIVARASRWIIENYLKEKLAKRTSVEIDDLFCQAVGRPAALLVFIIGLYVSMAPMLNSLTRSYQDLAERLFLAFGAASVAWAAYRLVEVLDSFLMSIAKRTDNNLDDLIVGIIRKIVKVCIVFLSVIFIGQILHFNITALLAGAGVAGLAVAFAAQDTIANFFGSLMIVVDQPFTVGDYVKIDSFEGTIERVGLRSTGLRTPAGHLITIPNKISANTSVENISRRPCIFKAANFSLAAGDAGKAQAAVKAFEEVFASHEGMSQERKPKIFLTDLKDSCFNVQVMVWYQPSDQMKFLAWWSRMNMEILKKLSEAGVKLQSQAEPTYVLAGDAERRLKVEQAAPRS